MKNTKYRSCNILIRICFHVRQQFNLNNIKFGTDIVPIGTAAFWYYEININDWKGCWKQGYETTNDVTYTEKLSFF